MELALIDLSEGRADVAASRLEEARRYLGDRVDLLNALGEAYTRVNDRGRARAALARSLQIDPSQADGRDAISNLDNR